VKGNAHVRCAQPTTTSNYFSNIYIEHVKKEKKKKKKGKKKIHLSALLRYPTHLFLPYLSWLLTQSPASTAQVSEISPASTVAAHISASLLALPFP
jgi:hypothetical protein